MNNISDKTNRHIGMYILDLAKASLNNDPTTNSPRVWAGTRTYYNSTISIKSCIRKVYEIIYVEPNFIKQRSVLVKNKETGKLDRLILDLKDMNELFELSGLNPKTAPDIMMFGDLPNTGNDVNTRPGNISIVNTDSLHECYENLETNTTRIASNKNKKGGSFSNRRYLVYATFGIDYDSNVHIMKQKKMTNKDFDHYWTNALWIFPMVVRSEQRKGADSLFTIDIVLKEEYENFNFSNIRENIKLICKKDREVEIRSIDDYDLDFSKLVSYINNNVEKIEKINYIVNERYKDKVKGLIPQLGSDTGLSEQAKSLFVEFTVDYKTNKTDPIVLNYDPIIERKQKEYNNRKVKKSE